jgi:hypothetical protein
MSTKQEAFRWWNKLSDSKKLKTVREWKSSPSVDAAYNHYKSWDEKLILITSSLIEIIYKDTVVPST